MIREEIVTGKAAWQHHHVVLDVSRNNSIFKHVQSTVEGTIQATETMPIELKTKSSRIILETITNSVKPECVWKLDGLLCCIIYMQKSRTEY